MLSGDLNSIPEVSVSSEKKLVSGLPKYTEGTQLSTAVCEKNSPAVKSTHTNLKQPPVNYCSTSSEISAL